MFLIRNILLLFIVHVSLFSDSMYRSDDAAKLGLNYRAPGSHIKVFFPTMPYLYLSKLINGTLVRSSDNKQGWEYMMAKSYKKVSPLVYDFYLREGVLFQDGTVFDANSVVENFEYLFENTFNYSDLFNRLKDVKKRSKYVVRFTFSKPYELFLFDLTMINLYSKEYLHKYGWGFSGASTSNSMKHPGPYGLGPYILKEGYATGREQTSLIKLEANPNYYDKPKPYIEKITIFTELNTKEVLQKALEKEGELDITPIPFNKKVETVLSSFSKLVIAPSTHNISLYLNMLKPKGVLKNKAIRVALNEAINQKNLLKFVYKGEGIIAPTAASQNYFAVREATKDLKTHYKKANENQENDKKLKNLLNGLVLNVVTMERFMFLWKGIEFQLKKYGVKLDYTVYTSEKDIYEQLLTNRKIPKQWDILAWGNDDWCSSNPWTVFFTYRTSDIWSAIEKDSKMQEYIQEFFETPYNTPSYVEIVKKITQRAYEKAYMLFVPSPNIVLAVNKEVDYKPSAVLNMPLWEAKVTPFHWSIRQGVYPKKREISVKPRRYDDGL